MEVSTPARLSEIKNGTSFKQDDDDNDGKHEISTVDSTPNDSNPPLSSVTSPHSNPNQTSKSIENSRKIMKKNKRVSREVSGSSTASSSSQQKGVRVTTKRRNPKVIIGFGGRRGEIDLDGLALPLGMSFAAVVAQVLDRKTTADVRIPADHLSKVFFFTLLAKNGFWNLVYGNRFDCFVGNFEKSFESTLRTLRMINTAFLDKGNDPSSHSSIDDYNSEVAQPTSYDEEGHLLSNSSMMSHHSPAGQPTSEVHEPFSSVEEIKENLRTDFMNQELILHRQINQQVACISRSTLDSRPSGFNQSLLSTFEKSVMEQARSNDLKSFEIGLMMKQLQLKESQLALNSDSNRLEKFKLSMGISKASFKTEKFKTQLEDTRHAELLKKCIDCLVAGLLIMSASLVYGAYVYSYERITEATASCTLPPKESKSWWMPKSVSSINSGLHSLRCQVEVMSRMLFGLLMILAIAYLLLQRSSTSKQTMPVTFLLLLLGGACGFAGKLCIDTLGGSGYHWLLYWEVLCMVHFFANICTSGLFFLLHGPVPVSQETKANTKLPYWIRRFVFYFITLLFLPILCGLMPFAGPGDWIDHFSSLATDALFGSEILE
ncbi:hypothetical protein BVC80_1761g36 [Macleaya cordata]|uniref:Protein CPR-5 n=1 Tax=Macleaya cordata TaxID=56857 RepID=A0A200QTA6_MACCD|nr:hypothetical protein BVC80_1761g36 [Macleaya cordata]